jgi:hypothetical protein
MLQGINDTQLNTMIDTFTKEQQSILADLKRNGYEFEDKKKYVNLNKQLTILNQFVSLCMRLLSLKKSLNRE